MEKARCLTEGIQTGSCSKMLTSLNASSVDLVVYHVYIGSNHMHVLYIQVCQLHTYFYTPVMTYMREYQRRGSREGFGHGWYR